MKSLPVLTALALATACGPQDDGNGNGNGNGNGTDIEVPDTYAFASRDDADTDSVAYDGQVFRQLLVRALEGELTGLTERLDAGYFPVEGQVRSDLEFYFDFDSATSGDLEHGVSFSPDPLQTTWNDVSSDKNLRGKLAGNDSATDHVDWSTDFTGWGAKGSTTPEALVLDWFDVVDAQAVAWSNGTVPLDPSGQPVSAVTLTPEGHDMRQLIGKFLGVALSLSQGADDYLDDDVDGKGLLADHSQLVDGKPYTQLEHQWDEAFGYFGASRDYAQRTDDEIADTPASDSDGDGRIDLRSEVSFSHSTNAAKRDRGSKVAIDLTAQAWQGFAGGRQLLAQTDGPLTDAELDLLRGYRDQATDAWEAAIAATALHYINDTLGDMAKFDTQDYSFADHAKHWSELKGFALGLQFNPNSPLTDSEFEQLHALLRDAPVLEDASAAERTGYADDLRAARDLLADAYDFPSENIGGENGEDGW